MFLLFFFLLHFYRDPRTNQTESVYAGSVCLDQQLDQFVVAVSGSQVERGDPQLGLGVNERPVGQQNVCYLVMAVFRR